MKNHHSDEKKDMDKKPPLTGRKRKIIIIILIILFLIFLGLATVAVLYYTSNLFPRVNNNDREFSLTGARSIGKCRELCGSHGTCHQFLDAFACLCDDGYFGRYCTKEKTSCSENPCRNGICKCSKTGFVCVCKENYTGKFCEKRKTEICTGPSGRCDRRNAPPQEEAGWYSPGNGYQYLLTKTIRSWEESRYYCHAFGADLATVGPRNVHFRTKLLTDLLKNENVWIGLNIDSTRKRWTWIDGVTARQSNAFWSRTKEDTSDSNCAMIESYYNLDFRSKKRSCFSLYRALCEKRIA